MLSQNQIKRLKNFFEKSSLVHFAYLYGSQTTNHARKDSDVDIAVFPKSPLTPTHYIELIETLSELLEKQVDLVALPETSLILRYEMLKSGQLLYAEDEHFFQIYVMHTMGLYLDFKHDRKKCEEKLIERIHHGE